MKRIDSFFWFCSGVHCDTLKAIPTEQAKYAGIGGSVFFTALFAAISGSYALYTVFSGTQASLFIALTFGVIWGLAIFNMDRYVLSTINKNAHGYKQLLVGVPRILLAVVIGIVVARPLQLKIFEKEIHKQLVQQALQEQKMGIETLGKTFTTQYQFEINRLNERKAQQKKLEVLLQEEKGKLNQELFGEKTKETSGIPGYGSFTKKREAALNAQQHQLDTLRKEVTSMENFLSGQRVQKGELEDLLSFKEIDSLAQYAGFADRNRALSMLAEDVSSSSAIRFVSFLFILIECLPIIVKLMASGGPYDAAVFDLNQYQIHESRKRKERLMLAIDKSQDYLTEKEIENRKRIVTT